VRLYAQAPEPPQNPAKTQAKAGQIACAGLNSTFFKLGEAATPI
jgi:hypothetical protein